jgi:hypothetical protein
LFISLNRRYTLLKEGKEHAYAYNEEQRKALIEKIGGGQRGRSHDSAL